VLSDRARTIRHVPRTRQFLMLSAMFVLACATAVAARAGDPTGTLTVCNGAGNPPVAGVITFSLVAPASEGGTQVVTLGAGACTGRYFFSQGLQVTVVENVPAGAVVSSITIKGLSTISASSPASGTATVTIGDADSTLTMTTSGGGAPTPKPCVVPRVVGLTLASARTAIKRNGCRVGSVSYVRSKRIPKGGVTSTSPRAGYRLAHNGRIRVYVSKGR
jgi:hypothetical protein